MYARTEWSPTAAAFVDVARARSSGRGRAARSRFASRLGTMARCAASLSYRCSCAALSACGGSRAAAPPDLADARQRERSPSGRPGFTVADRRRRSAARRCARARRARSRSPSRRAHFYKLVPGGGVPQEIDRRRPVHVYECERRGGAERPERQAVDEARHAPPPGEAAKQPARRARARACARLSRRTGSRTRRASAAIKVGGRARDRTSAVLSVRRACSRRRRRPSAQHLRRPCATTIRRSRSSPTSGSTTPAACGASLVDYTRAAGSRSRRRTRSRTSARGRPDRAARRSTSRTSRPRRGSTMVEQAQLEEVGSGLAPCERRAGSWSTRARRRGCGNDAFGGRAHPRAARRACPSGRTVNRPVRGTE